MILHAVQGYLLSLLVFGVAFYALLFLAYYLPQFIRTVIPTRAWVSILLTLPLVIASAVSYFKHRDTRKLILDLEERYPHLRERLLTLAELSERPQSISQDPFSQSLVLRLQTDMSQLVERFHFHAQVRESLLEDPFEVRPLLGGETQLAPERLILPPLTPLRECRT